MTLRVVQITGIDRDELFTRVRSRGDGFAVQLRSPELSPRAALTLGRELVEMGATVIVNDRLDIARAIGAAGIHLGQTSVTVATARAFLGPTLVTCSAHSVEEALARGREGADAVLLSPIFDTPGKGPALGLSALTEVKRGLEETALIALGGIDEARAREALAAGADGVAGIRHDLTPLSASS